MDLPSRITWLVAPRNGSVERICVEASSPNRVTLFQGRFPLARVVVVEFGLDPDGHPLPPHERKLLRNGIYRARSHMPKQTPNEKHAAIISRIMDAAAEIYGIERHWLCHPPEGRRDQCAKARRYVAHRLRDEVNLSTPNIAKVLNYSDPSGIRHCLAKPVEPP